MDFKRRFVLLVSLGVSFMLTLLATQWSLFAGGIVAMFAVVINYWVALIVLNHTIRRLGAETNDREEE